MPTDQAISLPNPTAGGTLMRAVSEAIAERGRGEDTRSLSEFDPDEQAALLQRASEILATRNDIVRRGQALYETHIRSSVESTHRGQFLVVDVDTGEYEIDGDELAATRRARAKRPDAALYLLRIGSPAAYRLRRMLPGGWA